MWATVITTGIWRKWKRTTWTQRVCNVISVSAKQPFLRSHTRTTSSARWPKWYCVKENIEDEPWNTSRTLTARKKIHEVATCTNWQHRHRLRRLRGMLNWKQFYHGDCHLTCPARMWEVKTNDPNSLPIRWRLKQSRLSQGKGLAFTKTRCEKSIGILQKELQWILCNRQH